MILAKITKLILNRVVRRIASKTRMRIDDELIDMLERPIYLSVIIVGLSLATELLALPDMPAKLTMGLLVTMAVFVFLFVLHG